MTSYLAKGKNNVNKLVEIVICWSIHKIDFLIDIKKMFTCKNNIGVLNELPFQTALQAEFSIVKMGGGHGGVPPHPTIFFENFPSKLMPRHRVPPLKNEAPPSEKQPPPPFPHWKLKPPSKKWFLEKNLEKLENTTMIT